MRTRSRLDLIAFLAILTMGTLMTALGVSASSLATIFLALSGLYGADRHPPQARAASRHRQADQQAPRLTPPCGRGIHPWPQKAEDRNQPPPPP